MWPHPPSPEVFSILMFFLKTGWFFDLIFKKKNQNQQVINKNEMPTTSGAD
jgi:hypothetical protein